MTQPLYAACGVKVPLITAGCLAILGAVIHGVGAKPIVAEIQALLPK